MAMHRARLRSSRATSGATWQTRRASAQSRRAVAVNCGTSGTTEVPRLADFASLRRVPPDALLRPA